MSQQPTPRNTENSELKIRVACPDDGAAIATIYVPIVRDTFISFEIDPPTAEDMSVRIASTLAQYPWLVAEDRGTVIGYAYGSAHRSRSAYQWSCDVSVYVDANSQGRGLGRLLYTGLLAILKRQNYAAAYAGIALPNDASVAIHERMGFRLIGVYPRVGFKHGSWRDVGWWHLPLADLSDEPPGPIPFPQLAP
ncbi:MAG: arsinothricin resistance N-acetyltransferase ArsN1 family B [Pseudomonadota bacterium]